MSLERKAMSALKWATAAKLVVQVLSWAGTLIVVRLLSPDDYGLMAKVAVVCALAGVVAELGLEAAIVQSADIQRDDLRKLCGVAMAFGAATTMLVALSSPLLAHLLHEPQLTWPVRVASLQIFIGSLAMVPVAVATRDLSFRRLSTIEMAAGIATIAVTLVLAVAGAAVWALVFGTLVGAIVRTTALLVFGERVLPRFSFAGIGERMKFGLTLVANRLSYHAVVQSDVLIGSGFLSTTEIGQYAVALQLATLPMSKVMGTINQVLLPAVARRQDEPARVRDAVLRSIRFIALVAFPALWGISATAPELVRVLFGAKWLDAVPALMILPLIVPMRMVCGVIFTASLALGNRTIDLRNTMINLVAIPTGYFIGAHWGLVGLCASTLVSVPLAYAFGLPPVLRLIGIRASSLFAECGLPAVAAVLMYVAVVALRPAVGDYPALVRLAALSGAGAVIYVTIIALISRRHLLTARDFARSVFAGDSPNAV